MERFFPKGKSIRQNHHQYRELEWWFEVVRLQPFQKCTRNLLETTSDVILRHVILLVYWVRADERINGLR